MDETKLKEKLRHIEALFAGATTAGEREAAAEARKRIRARLEVLARDSPAVEMKFTLGDVWSRRVFLALLRRYEIEPYRYRGQRRTTVMARASRRFVEETLWPEYQQIYAALHAFLDETTSRIIAETIHRDSSEPEEVAAPRQLAWEIEE